jgi:hypothetical protein
LAVAAVFVWLGMVLAISFVEAPLKFRAPGVTLKIGLGIGRLVFRALNVFEYVFAIVIAAALFTHETSAAVNVALCAAVGALLTQTIVCAPCWPVGPPPSSRVMKVDARVPTSSMWRSNSSR